MIAHVRRLGLVEYEDALRMQEGLVAARQQEQIPDQVLLVQHPHIYTLGRRAKPEHILIDEETRRRLGVGVHESVRGGDVTYHGPGQIVMYPILAMPLARQDVVRYVRDLEEVMIRTVAELGITAGRIEGLSGAWVGQDKIGAIGVRFSRWVSSHGIALNVNTDLSYFTRIIACGIRDHGVTSLEKLLGAPVDIPSIQALMLRHLAEIFGLELEERPIDMPTVQVVIYRRNPGLELLNLHRVPAKGDFWQPVTGRIEPGETPLEAAIREVAEETGLSGVVEDLGYEHSFMMDPAYFPGPPTLAREHSFALEVPADAQPRLEEGGHDAYRWLPLEPSLAQLLWQGNREAMSRVAARIEAPSGARIEAPSGARSGE